MIQAIGKNVIVKAVKEEKKAVIITLKDEKPTHFEVVSVGEDVKIIKKGDKVLLSPYGGTEITHNEEKLIVVSIDNVYAKL